MLALLHTTIETVKPARALRANHAPDVQAFNIVDDGFLPLLAGGPTPPTLNRLRAYLEQAKAAGAAAVLCCCSSLGAIGSALSTPPLPFLRLHEAAADDAVLRASVGVLATGETPLRAVTSLVQERAALAARTPRIEQELAKGAFAALIAGREQEHDDLVVAALETLANRCEVIMFAQLTIERIVARLSPELADRVLPSGALGFARAGREIARG